MAKKQVVDYEEGEGMTSRWIYYIYVNFACQFKGLLRSSDLIKMHSSLSSFLTFLFKIYQDPIILKYGTTFIELWRNPTKVSAIPHTVSGVLVSPGHYVNTTLPTDNLDALKKWG